MPRPLIAAFAVLAFLVAGGVPAPGAQAKPLNILLITSGCCHDWQYAQYSVSLDD